MVILFLAAFNILSTTHSIQLGVTGYFIPISLFTEISINISSNAKIFLIVVRFVSAIIYLYSYFYLGVSKDINTFRSVLIIFVLSIIFLILSESFFAYILGWDGLGVRSFLLVVYYSSLLATRSGLATFITNRLGDFFIIISFIFLIALDPTLAEINHWSQPINFKIFNILFFVALLIGAFTKRAQIPFSAWLPAAIAAPTPVSALVHSSTLVTAGLYIISKFLSKIDINTNLSLFFCLATVLLSFLAGVMAVVEPDLKKLVAISTLRQMGLIGYILFIKEVNIALFHIFSHATFKSLLFIVVGSFIIYNTGFQDMRVKTSSLKKTKFAVIIIVSASMSLIGIIYSSGFFSKDLIILSLPSNGVSILLYILLISSCILTVCYTIKTFKLLLNNIELTPIDTDKKFSSSLAISGMGLFLFTIIFGYFFFWGSIDQELYTIEAANKLIGVWILIAGGILTILYWKKNLLFSIRHNSIKYKKTTTFFLQITNLNWISNNFFTSILKLKNINFYEPIWWAYISEKSTKNAQNLNKPESLKAAFPIKPLEQTLYFLVFFINIRILYLILM